ncbi:hypothetical protein H4S02_003267 [Coemansia sp. RSA 2611]|nr:hypothetical protein H4S02_003267 [Coemansia sp. RSA 2611]
MAIGKAQRRGRVTPRFKTQFEGLLSRIYVQSMVSEYRQLTTIRLPSQRTLPLLPVTILTLGVRMHSLLTFTPPEQVTSAVPLLTQRSETRLLRLASQAATIRRALREFRTQPLPLQSTVPWVLLARCHEFGITDTAVVATARALRGPEPGLPGLLLYAYVRLGWDRELRAAVDTLCVEPERLDAATLVCVLAELQGTLADRALASRFWAAQLDLKGFAPSQACVQLAVRAALHSDNIKLAIVTYERVLQGQWPVASGFWLEKLLVYGLALKGLVSEALELVSATARTDSAAAALRTAHLYELLLRALSCKRRVDEAMAVMSHVRTFMRPTLAMYSSVAGAVAAARGWSAAQEVLAQINDDGLTVPDVVWKRVLLGVARCGRINECNDVLSAMTAAGISPSYVTVQAAVDVYAENGNIEMLARWARVVLDALAAQARVPWMRQRAVRIDGARFCVSDPVVGEAMPDLALNRPGEFTQGLIDRNELVWHRSVLVSLVSAVGRHGSAEQVVRLWEALCSFRGRVRSLRFSPQLYMALARALAWHGLLSRYEPLVLAWARDSANGFSHSQLGEIGHFVSRCRGGERGALTPPRIRQAEFPRHYQEMTKSDSIWDPTRIFNC